MGTVVLKAFPAAIRSAIEGRVAVNRSANLGPLAKSKADAVFFVDLVLTIKSSQFLGSLSIQRTSNGAQDGTALRCLCRRGTYVMAKEGSEASCPPNEFVEHTITALVMHLCPEMALST